MCGIVGVATFHDRLDPAVRLAMPGMMDALRHRGPDSDGIFADEHVALGHRRLAIIDRAAGSQPMSNEDGSCWVVFNGEIYNHRSLKEQLLSRGHTFRTTSDTEVIVHAYEEFGTGCVERFEGMFAFAVYDQRRHELFLARDRVGKKPLFYATFDGIFHFASEIKAFYPSPAWNGALDLSGLEGFLSLGYLIAPNTIYRHVRKLEPGHWARLHDGGLEVRQYWDVERFDDDPRSAPELRRDLEAILSDAVRDRMESEVPLGAFLSGGIDSGLVVSFMADHSCEPIVTTSVGFGDAAHNELSTAGLTAARYATRHHPEVVEPQLDSLLDTIVGAFDEPFADSSAVPTYYVSAAARRHVTVALTGDGGDEAFGGYDFRYTPHALEAAVRSRMPAAGRRAASWIGARWPRSPQLPRPFRLGSLLENVGRDAAAAYFADLCFLKPAQTRALLGLDPNGDPRASSVYEAVTAPYRRCPSTSAVQRAQYADLKVYLPNDVLTKVDRMSMLHGLEVRCPLLDRRVVEFAFRVPTATKMPGLRPKHLLRSLASSRLPEALLHGPKRGFTAPVSRWLRGPYAAAFQLDVLHSGSFAATVLDLNRVAATFEEHRLGIADHAHALWAVWVLERWHKLQRTPAASRAASAEVLPGRKYA